MRTGACLRRKCVRGHAGEDLRGSLGQHGSLSVHLTVPERFCSTSFDISCFRPYFWQPIGFINGLGRRVKVLTPPFL